MSPGRQGQIITTESVSEEYLHMLLTDTVYIEYVHRQDLPGSTTWENHIDSGTQLKSGTKWWALRRMHARRYRCRIVVMLNCTSTDEQRLKMHANITLSHEPLQLVPYMTHYPHVSNQPTSICSWHH